MNSIVLCEFNRSWLSWYMIFFAYFLFMHSKFVLFYARLPSPII